MVKWKLGQLLNVIRDFDILGGVEIHNSGFAINHLHLLISIDYPISNTGSMSEQMANGDFFGGWLSRERSVRISESGQNLWICELRNVFRDRVV